MHFFEESSLFPHASTWHSVVDDSQFVLRLRILHVIPSYQFQSNKNERSKTIVGTDWCYIAMHSIPHLFVSVPSVSTKAEQRSLNWIWFANPLRLRTQIRYSNCNSRMNLFSGTICVIWALMRSPVLHKLPFLLIFMATVVTFAAALVSNSGVKAFPFNFHLHRLFRNLHTHTAWVLIYATRPAGLTDSSEDSMNAAAIVLSWPFTSSISIRFPDTLLCSGWKRRRTFDWNNITIL